MRSAAAGGDASARVVGRIVKPHGLRGEVVVAVSTDMPEHRFAEGACVRLAGRGRAARELTVLAARPHGERMLVRFAGVDGADDAEALRGGVLVADPADLPSTGDADEFYDQQLEGLAVCTADGADVGTVREVTHGPGGELLVVDAGSGEVMIPFVQDIVTEVDLPARRIVVDPPEGLLAL